MAFMAPRIELNDVPDETFEVLKRRADVMGVSVAECARGALIEYARQPTAAEVFARAAERPSAGVSIEDIVAIQREMRDR